MSSIQRYGNVPTQEYLRLDVGIQRNTPVAFAHPLGGLPLLLPPALPSTVGGVPIKTSKPAPPSLPPPPPLISFPLIAPPSDCRRECAARAVLGHRILPVPTPPSSPVLALLPTPPRSPPPAVPESLFHAFVNDPEGSRAENTGFVSKKQELCRRLIIARWSPATARVGLPKRDLLAPPPPPTPTPSPASLSLASRPPSSCFKIADDDGDNGNGKSARSLAAL